LLCKTETAPVAVFIISVTIRHMDAEPKVIYTDSRALAGTTILIGLAILAAILGVSAGHADGRAAGERHNNKDK
jgi:hypothetical protein